MNKIPTKLFYFSILPSAILYIAILFISNFYNIKLSLVVRDLAQTCGYPIGVGMISNIGILLWGAAASICLFTAFQRALIENHPNYFYLGDYSQACFVLMISFCFMIVILVQIF